MSEAASEVKSGTKANGGHVSRLTVQKPSITVSDLDTSKVSPSDSDSDEEPPQISSEQLLRRASFKKILEDLSSSADAINKPGIGDPLVSAAAATVQAQAAQQALLQQAGLSNPALLPLLQNLQQSAAANASSTSSDLSQQIAAMILPGQLNAQQQLQLQSALLNSAAAHQSPFIAGQGLSSNVLQSALLNAAASNTALSNLSSQLASANSLPTLSKLSTATSLVSSGSTPAPDDTTRKREVRLMKNREAARECRRKKKEYIRCLENRVAVLESQNQALIGELRALKDLYLPKNQE